MGPALPAVGADFRGLEGIGLASNSKPLIHEVYVRGDLGTAHLAPFLPCSRAGRTAICAGSSACTSPDPKRRLSSVGEGFHI